MQTILGSGGAIGAPLAKELTKYTSHIRLVSRNPIKVNTGDELFSADLTDKAQVEKAICGSEIVYLVVGLEYNTAVWQRCWPLIIDNVISACLLHQVRLVFLDNVYAYASAQISRMNETTMILPSSNKGKIRAGLHEKIFVAIKQNGLKALIARSADFYGQVVSQPKDLGPLKHSGVVGGIE
ncbi:NAD(P)H-binding protein [Dyadobacter crusticola]|uniref:NAD(P)H-binding protein n=1 Tax=Dyadobacter crusticola TaxID=292407 RepID=UPI000689CFDA|nr:NAD(P)H-binding protein [Dyadobacter crusticola]